MKQTLILGKHGTQKRVFKVKRRFLRHCLSRLVSKQAEAIRGKPIRLRSPDNAMPHQLGGISLAQLQFPWEGALLPTLYRSQKPTWLLAKSKLKHSPLLRCLLASPMTWLWKALLAQRMLTTPAAPQIIIGLAKPTTRSQKTWNPSAGGGSCTWQRKRVNPQ